MTTNINMVKNCAFCKYWYDPTNSAIKPVAAHQNMWAYEDRALRKCIKTNTDKPAYASCARFESKMF